MRSSVSVTNERRILCVFPAYTPSFGTFSHAYKLMPGVHAFMPPQGLLLIAAPALVRSAALVTSAASNGYRQRLRLTPPYSADRSESQRCASEG
jgi:hypothetical protein